MSTPSPPSPWKIVGIDFSHMHMGDLLRSVADHPNAEIAGICDTDPDRMATARETFTLPDSKVFTDYKTCLEQTKPDLIVLCPPTADHALWVERVAPFGAHVFVEKPFAATLADADRMTAAMDHAGKQLVINWPLRWVPSHFTAHRLIRENLIGEVIEIHHYGGNRGPLYHGAGKTELEPSIETKQESWWYKKESGGGSLRDYLGYGVTIGTWFNGGKKPIDVTCVTSGTPGLEVDEHSITIARYAEGLSKFETRWGTFTDPWIHQPQPKCGFVIRGQNGTIGSYDYGKSIRIQTSDTPEGYDHPLDTLPEGERNPIEYVITRLDAGLAIEGPLSPTLSRIGQQIIDTAILSAQTGKTVPLIGP